MKSCLQLCRVLRRDAGSMMSLVTPPSVGRMGFALVAPLALIAILPAQSADARVSRFVVEQKRQFAAGINFGSVGPYERLDGTAYMEVDPRDSLNAVIIN